MDWRILIVALPVLAALGWVVFNVGAIALQQAQSFLSKSE
jgi:photosystem II PsbY protein